MKNSKKSKKLKNNNINTFEEKILFQSFQNKKLTTEITSITYFKFNNEDIIEDQQHKESSSINSNNLSLELTADLSIMDKKDKKLKKEIYLDASQIKNKLFIFLENIDNLIYVIDSHSFEKLFKFREESKTNKEKCKLMFQSENKKSTLICVHENKLNINKIRIINSINKSKIYCEQIQSILFGNNYITLYDIKEINNGELIMGLEGCLFIWDKTNKTEYINMSNAEEKKLYEKLFNKSNFPKLREGYYIINKGNHHYIPNKLFYLNNINHNNKILSIDRTSVKNILPLNNLIFAILINLNDNISIIRFYDINEKEIFFEKKNDIIINDFQYKKLNITKLFYINDKFFGLINIENIIILSSNYKQIVTLYQINEVNLLNNNKHHKKLNNFFIPSCFLVSQDHYLLIQFYDTKTNNIFLKMFRFLINNKNNFSEIMNVTKTQLKSDEVINYFLPFKNVKDIKEHDVNFSAKFFITYHKDNNIKKWIITGYEK